MTPMCSVDGCTDPARQRGWCSKHYFRWYRYGSLAMPASHIPNPGPCAVPGCDRVARVTGLCLGHYGRQRAGMAQRAPGAAFTAPFSPRPSQNHRNPCQTAGCARRVYAWGLCQKHYAQAKRDTRADPGARPGS